MVYPGFCDSHPEQCQSHHAGWLPVRLRSPWPNGVAVLLQKSSLVPVLIVHLGGLLTVLHHKLLLCLCTTPKNSLTTPQSFYALLKLLLPMAICVRLCHETHAKTPWNFDFIFSCLAEWLAAQSFSLGLATPSGIIIAAPQDQSDVQICTPLANVIGVICCHQLCSASSCQTHNPASLEKKVISACYAF
jgi:hypothetical protein